MEFEMGSITAKDAKKYFKCGGYDGRANGLNAEETCFGLYMYAIENTIGIWSMSKQRMESPYTQAQVDMLVAVLDNYIMTNCYDRQTKKAMYNSEHFLHTFKNFKPINTSMPITNIDGLMPFVVQYVLAEHGIQFEDKNRLMGSVCSNFETEAHGGNKYVYPKQTMKDIDVKLGRRNDLDL